MQLIIAEIRHAKHASEAPWVRFFGKSIHARNFGYDLTHVQSYVHPPVQTVGVEVGRQDSLQGREFSGGNHISDEQWDKEQEEHVTRGDEI